MIGKITIGKSFNGCIKYCLNDKLPEQKQERVMVNRAEVLLFNQCYGNERELIQQFNEVRQLNSKLSKPVLHITLSLAPGEQLPKDKLMELCRDCAKDMGFENNQYVAIHHKDTSHQHLHIVVNRIGFDKRTVSDSNNFQKMDAYCRKMELKFNLTPVLSPRQFLPKEQRQIPRLNARMTALGYQVLKGRGISFIDDKKVKIKGSEVGFSLMKIEKTLALKQNPDNINEYEKLQSAESQRQERNAGKLSPLLTQQIVLKKQSQSPVIDLQNKGAKLIYQIIEPDNISNQLSPELLKKRRKKKRQRPRL